MSQLTFFDILPGIRWVEIKPGCGHKIFEDGQKFLVIEVKEDDGWLLCWKNGHPPKMWPLTRGTLLNPQYVRDIERR